MTIKTRLFVMLGVAVIGLAAVFGTGKKGIDTCQVDFDKVVDDRMPKIDAADHLVANSIRQDRDIREMVLAMTAEQVKSLDNNIAKVRGENKKYMDYLHEHIHAEKGKALLHHADETREILRKLNSQITELAHSGNKEQATALILSNAYHKAGHDYRHVLEEISAMQKEEAHHTAIESRESSAAANMWMIVISGVAMLVLLGIAWMVIRAIGEAIQQIVGNVGQVASSMRFGTRLPSRDDELNDVSVSMNQLLSALEQGVSEANKVVGAIAQADFAQRMNGNYVGDLDILKQGVNGSANSVSFMMGELEKVMNGLNAGKFDVRMDAKVPQAFRDLVETALNSISHVITDVNMVMGQMTEGDFNGRVKTNATGDMLLLKNSINDSMTAIARAISAISEVVAAQAQGDLTMALPSGTFKGQLHDLKNAINFSSQKVKESVIQAIDASNIVNEAANQVSQGSTDLSGRVQEQAAALEETSATMNEMAVAVQANTSNAKKVAELAHQVQHQAGAGVDVMQQTISAMQSIKESSSKIADIVTLIDGIAFQTNLLALNAAVEAARAGEHGRGFAVVAGEVRALAQKSAEAAKDIKELINDSVSRIEAGTQLADKSGDMLSGITGSIEQVAEMIEAIANASSEQTAGIHQVHKAIADIDKVTQENAALVEETTAAAESLSTEANHLKENMGFFKTGTTSNAHYHAKTTSSPIKKASMGLPSPKANAKTEGDWNSF